MGNDKSRDKWGEGDGEGGKDRKKKKKQLFEVKEELEEEEEVAAPPQAAAADGERVCEICHRVFKSGKALGGHMRVHFLPKNDQNKKTNQSNGKDPQTQIPRCPLCQKIFPSMKSMYGHLRSHPERDWRGSQPPSTNGCATGNANGLAAGTNDGDDRMDGVINHDSSSSPSSTRSSSLMLMRWSLTARRGSRGNKPISDTLRNLIERDENLLEASQNLWLLSRGKTRVDDYTPPSILIRRGSSSRAAAAEVAAEDDVLSSAKSTTTSEEESSSAEEESCRKFIKHLKVNLKAGSNIDESRRITLKINCNNKKNKRKLVMDLDPSRKYMKSSNNVRGCSSSNNKCCICGKHILEAEAAATENEKGLLLGKYKCSICDKGFVTYHGLGGHMSIHSKERNSIPARDNKDQSSRRRSKQQVDIGIGISLKNNFSMAQSLEGETKGEDNNNNNVGQGENNHVIKVHFDLNLNETPPQQEEDDNQDDDDNLHDDDSGCSGEYANN